MIAWSERRPRGWAVLLAAFYAAAFVILTWPAWAAPGAVIIGHPDSDVWKHLWGDAWFVRELGTVFPVPLSTQLIGFPDGGLLYNLDPVTGLWVAAVAPVIGIPLAHNLALGTALVGGAMAAANLSWRLCGHIGGAAVAGAIYGFSAQLLCLALASGVGEVAHVAWLPLSLIAALDLCQRGRWTSALWGAPCLALSALGSWYYGLVTAMGVVAGVAWYGSRAGWRRPQIAEAVLKVGAMAALAALLVAPFAVAFLTSVRSSDALNSAAAAGVAHRDLLPRYNGAVLSLGDLIVPRLPRINLVRDWLIFSNHPGFLAVALAAAVALRSRLVAGLVGLGLAALAVGFGPVIHVDRATPFLPNPVYLTLEGLPALSMIRNLERFQVPFTLALALAAGVGLARLGTLAGLSRNRRGAVGVAVAALAVVDAWWVSGLPFPLPTAEVASPAIYRRLAEEGAPGALIELPITDRPAGRGYWYQTEHLRPLPLNLEGALAASLAENPLMLNLISPAQVNLYDADGVPPPLTPQAALAGREALVRQGFAYVSLTARADGRDDDEVGRLRPLLRGVLGAPVWAEGEVEVYALSDPEAR